MPRAKKSKETEQPPAAVAAPEPETVTTGSDTPDNVISLDSANGPGSPADSQPEPETAAAAVENGIDWDYSTETEVWHSRIKWDLLPESALFVCNDYMGAARLYPEKPEISDGEHADWFTDNGNEFELFPELNVMPDFCNENDWRKSLCRRPLVVHAGSPFDIPAVEAQPSNKNPDPFANREPIPKTEYDIFMAKLAEPGYLERIFSAKLDLTVEKHALILGAMGGALRAHIEGLLEVPDAYYHKVTPTLKMGTGTEFDLTGGSAKVKYKSRFTVKKEVSVNITVTDCREPELPFDRMTPEERQEAADKELFGEDPEHGEDDLDTDDGAPMPEGDTPPPEEQQEYVFGQGPERPYTADELKTAGATLKQLDAEAAARQEADEIAAEAAGEEPVAATSESDLY